MRSGRIDGDELVRAGFGGAVVRGGELGRSGEGSDSDRRRRRDHGEEELLVVEVSEVGVLDDVFSERGLRLRQAILPQKL